MLGKFKRSLKDRCPDCGKILEIRVRDIKTIRDGIPVSESEEYISCSNRNCDYEKNIEQRRRRKQEESPM